MTKVKVRFGQFTYKRPVSNPRNPDETILIRTVARRGDEIEVNDFDLERGERLGAFGDDPVPEEGGEAVNIADLDGDELAEYIEDEELNVDETVALAGDDPALAQRVLDAEEAASGGEPRKGVEDGLNRIIDAE